MSVKVGRHSKCQSHTPRTKDDNDDHDDDNDDDDNNNK